MPEWLKRELPPPPRRERLPTPKQREKSVSLWSIIKECVGKDLSRVCLPVFFNEPLSSLQRIAEEMEYSELLDEVRHHREILSKALLMLVTQCLCKTCPCSVQAYYLIHDHAWWYVIATMPGPVTGRVPRQCGRTHIITSSAVASARAGRSCWGCCPTAAQGDDAADVLLPQLHTTACHC